MSDFATVISGGLDTPRFASNLAAMVRKQGVGWTTISQLSSVLQVVFGFVLASVSTLYLMHGVRFSGQLIGAISIVLGLIGLAGLRANRPSMQMLFVVGMGFIALMTFEFTVQVGRDVDVHCSLAETYSRIAHLEEKMVAMRHDDMAIQLFARLNEVDDMLDMVQSGNLDQLSVDPDVHNLMQQDLHYIESKIHALTSHADMVLQKLGEAEAAAEEGAQTAKDPKMKKRQKEIQAAIQARLENVTKVLDTLAEKERTQEGLTYEEYETLFEALSGGSAESEGLHEERSHLPFLKAAWDRYTEGYAPDRNSKVQSLEQHRMEQRARFEQAFEQTMNANSRTRPPAFHESLMEHLEDIPEHCLQENEHLVYFIFGGWMLIMAQVATAYVTATSILFASTKKDF